MKVITVPGTVELKEVQGDPISFKKFLMTHLDAFEGIKTPSQVRQAAKIAGAIEDCNGSLSLEDAEYETLKSAVQSVKYIPKISRQLIAYYDAFDRAESLSK